MSKSSAGFVPDFSTLVGSGTRNVATTYRYKRQGSTTWTTSNRSDVAGRRYKSPTVKGFVDPFTGHKKATNYSRIIHTCQNLSETFAWTSQDRIGWPFIDQEATSPVVPQGIQMVDGGLYSTTSGAVNVHPDYVNRAIAEAYEALVDSKINLGQALAELGETLGWLANLVRRLVETLLIVRDAIHGRVRRAYAHRKVYANANRVQPNTRVRNNRWRSAHADGVSPIAKRWRKEAERKWWNDEAYSRWLKQEQRRNRRQNRKRKPSDSVGSAWLEYQYALMPLIYDIYGTMEALKEGLRGDNLLFSVQRTIGGPVSPDKLCAATGTDTSIDASGSVRQSARVVYFGRMRASSLSAAVELGLNNPWAIAWELVPFSFVVDWILPIGKVLNSFTAPLGVTFVDGWLDKLISGKLEATRLQPGLGRYISGTRPTARFKILAFQRTTYLTWPLAGAYLRSPFSYAHAAMALALLAQLSK